MRWDLGLQAIGTLLLMSIAFGVFAQLLFWRKARWWPGVIATFASFAIGIFVSEFVFGWATEEDLQPNIDGLSFDEVLITFLLGVPVAFAIRYLVRDRRAHPVAG